MSFVSDVTSKSLFYNSNYTVDLVVWSKFGNSSIYKIVVVIISVISEFDQKKLILWGVFLVQVI